MAFKHYRPNKKDKIYFDKVNKQLFQVRSKFKVENSKVKKPYNQIEGFIISNLCKYYNDCKTVVPECNRIIDANYIEGILKDCVLMDSNNFKDYLEYDNIGLRIKLEYIPPQLKHIYKED